jgi:hypothetical protein
MGLARRPGTVRSTDMATMTYREALNLALSEEMRRDERVFVIGDEVGLNEGADEMTQRLLNEFDPPPRRPHAYRGVWIHRHRHRRGDGRLAPRGRADDVRLRDACARSDR